MSDPALKRRPPAFQEYASDLMGDERIREMTLERRGLFQDMRRHCWVNGDIPREPERIARLIGADIDVVTAGPTCSNPVLRANRPHSVSFALP